MPGRWRELHVRGQKLIRAGTFEEKIPELLGITPIRWAEIVEACAARADPMPIGDEELILQNELHLNKQDYAG